MKRPRICAAIVDNNPQALREIEPLIDLLEVRIDLIGSAWQELVKQLRKPWIACNRSASEGGSWKKSEVERIKELINAS